MKIRTNKIAPLALTVALAFGVAACEDAGEGLDAVEEEVSDEDVSQDTEETVEEPAEELEEEVEQDGSETDTEE